MVTKRLRNTEIHADNIPKVSQKEMFQYIYDHFFRMLVGYAYKFINVENDAEDIVQEVFLQLWTKRDTLYERKTLLRLLYTCVRNRCIDYLKHQTVEQACLSEMAKATEKDIDVEVFAAEIYSRLFLYIDNLPPRQRMLIQLAIDGKRNYEIAEEMQISIETVKRQKRNAIDKLRALFKQDEELVLLLFLYSIAEV